MVTGLSNYIYFKDIDSHFIIKIFNIRIRLKHKSKFLYNDAVEYGLTTKERSQKIIVTLTSFPKRINTVSKTINTILRQSVKPDKIILWLAKEEFPKGKSELPEDLLKLEKLGLTIDWCENLLSYKKLIPTLRLYPNDIIITADDDIYYEEDWIESLYSQYLKNPEYVYVRRAIRVKYDGNNLIRLSDRQTDYKNFLEPSYLNQLVGCGGCLYPPGCFYKDIYNIKFLSIIPTHDDIYFWFMLILNHKKIQIVKGFEANVYCIEGTQKFGLCKQNNNNSVGMPNQKAYEIMLKEYPQVLDIIKNDNNQKTKDINVCLSCDDNYSKYAGVVIASILYNADAEDNLHFYILDGKISQENKEKLLSLKHIKNCEINFVPIDESMFDIYKQINTHDYITLASFYILKMAELLSMLKKVIYLDCDMVVNSTLKDIYNYDLQNKPIGAVLDARVKRKKKWKHTKYINSGMIVFDLNKIRQEKIEDKFIEYTKNNIKNIDTGDQDIINFTLKDNIQILPDIWNVQVSGFASRTNFTRYPKIVHYIGPDKPWIFASLTFFKNLYFKYLQLTPWALSDDEKLKWYKENKKATFIRFWKKRPLCFIHPKYLYAFYRSYILNK